MKTITCHEIRVGDKVKIPRNAHINPFKATELDREYWLVNVSYVSNTGEYVTVIGSAFQLELHHSHHCTLESRPEPLRHITHEGVYAGTPYCGITRENSDDIFAHYGKWVRNPDLNVCEKCIRIRDEEGEE